MCAKKGKHVVVTGGAGFIGCNLVRHLIANTQDQVLVLDKLTYAGNLESLADLKSNPRFSFAAVDICDADAVERAFSRFQPDTILHLAAESHVDRSINGPNAFIQTNLVGTYTILEKTRKYLESLASAKKQRFRILHVSTDEVYGTLGFDDPAFTERSAYDPHSPYSASKAGSDHLARAWHKTYNLPVLITNCSNNYGPYQFPEKLIPVVILKALHGEPIPVYGKGENIRDWLYVGDHVTALCEVLAKGEPGRTYNIGGNNEWQNIDLVRLICTILDDLIPIEGNDAFRAQRQTITGYQDLIKFVQDRPGHDLRYAIDATKIRQEIGWQPSEDFDTGFRKTVQWYLDNRPWWERILSGAYHWERQGFDTGMAHRHNCSPRKPI